MGLYPAADEQYTFAAQPDEDRDSYEILVDLRDETNMWGVSALDPYLLFCLASRNPSRPKQNVGTKLWIQKIARTRDKNRSIDLSAND